MKNQEVIKNLEGEKFIDHALKSQRIKRFLLNNWYSILQMPVCSHCETLAFWHRIGDEGVAYCPNCGTVTHNPITMQAFLEEGLHTDKVVHPDAPKYLDGEKVDAIAEVTAGEAGLDGDPNRVIRVKE